MIETLRPFLMLIELVSIEIIRFGIRTNKPEIYQLGCSALLC